MKGIMKRSLRPCYFVRYDFKILQNHKPSPGCHLLFLCFALLCFLFMSATRIEEIDSECAGIFQ